MAQIQPLDIVAPGARGLNSENAQTLLDPSWATVALNAVINRSGRIAARKGWSNQTTTAIAGTPTIDVLHEHLDKDGTSQIVSAAGNKIFKDITDFTVAANDITSATAPTADNWQFENFNGVCIGMQKGHAPIAWPGTGDFANITFTGTGPDGNCFCAAFGRIWAADADLQTIRISALLSYTDFSSASGGGTIDMSSVWTNGMDEITAIAAIGGNLIVFGRHHIVFWADGTGSEIGMTLARMQIVDTIEGTGCVARDSVVATGEGDLLFLSRHGVQSLGRVIESKSNPTTILSKYCRAELLAAMAQQRSSDADFDQVRAVHHPEEGLYIINFPAVGKQYVFDTHHGYQEYPQGPSFFPITVWQLGGGIAGMVSMSTGVLYFGTNAGTVGMMAGSDDNGSAYDFEWSSGWLDFSDLNHRLKMLKEIVATVAIGTGTIAWNWQFDFNGTDLTRSVSYAGSTTAEFNVAEFNIDEFSGGVIVARKSIPAHGEGQFMKIGVTSSINGYGLVLQQVSLSPGVGRMVT